MKALLCQNHVLVSKISASFRSETGMVPDWDAVYSAKARNGLFAYKKGEVYSLHLPLSRAAYDLVLVDGSLELFESGTALDFIAHVANALSPDGKLYLDKALFAESEGTGRLSNSMVDDLLGTAQDSTDIYLMYRGRDEQIPENRSIVGWYANHRANAITTRVTGGAIMGSAPEIANAVFRRMVWRGADIETSPKRYHKSVVVDVVNRVRSGELGPDNPATVPPRSEIRYNWNWERYGERFQIYSHSWDNYLLQGSIYKAATIAAVLRRLYPERKDLSFIEHGGSSALVTGQLLLDLPNLALGVCTEIDLALLLNGLNLFNSYEDRLNGRMYVCNESAEEFVYDRAFDVIAFIHMLLYVRRDLLPLVLQRSWDALEPGGVLISFENTHPPTTLSGPDSDIIFMREELESYLAPFGEIQYATRGTGQPCGAEVGEKAPVLRYVRKPD